MHLKKIIWFRPGEHADGGALTSHGKKDIDFVSLSIAPFITKSTLLISNMQFGSESTCNYLLQKVTIEHYRKEICLTPGKNAITFNRFDAFNKLKFKIFREKTDILILCTSKDISKQLIPLFASEFCNATIDTDTTVEQNRGDVLILNTENSKLEVIKNPHPSSKKLKKY